MGEHLFDNGLHQTADKQCSIFTPVRWPEAGNFTFGPATSHFGPAGRQLVCWAESSTTVKRYWHNKILFKRYTFTYDPNQH